MGRAPFVQNVNMNAVAPATVGMSTGRTDSKGREIFEYDVLAPCRPGSRLRYAVVFDTRLSAFVVVAAGHVAGPRKSLWRLLCRTPMMVVGDITTSPEAFNAGRSARYPPL